MIPTVKMSHTILEFGKALINDLPDAHEKAELEGVILLITTIWNTVIIDSNNRNKVFEKELLQTLKDEPKEYQLIVKRLIKRKKSKFSHDPRLVGENWVKERNGNFTFVCESRLNVSDTTPSPDAH
jgi:hypothetical protein